MAGAQLERPEPPPAPDAFRPAPPTGLSKVFAKSRYEQAFEEGRVRYEGAVQEHAARERQQTLALERSRAEWRAAAEAANAEARRQHAEVDAFEADYRRGVQDAVAAYCSMVLEASQYPKSFPQQFKLAYVPGSRQAVVEYELPTVAVVPAVKTHRYVKTSDTVAETPRPQAQVKTLYASVVAQVAIRTVHELLEADAGGHVDTVVFNGVVETTDPGSGRRMRPCLVTVRTTRDTRSVSWTSRTSNLCRASSTCPPECRRARRS
jgi:restriction system protein